MASFLSPRGQRQGGRGHRQTVSTADVSSSGSDTNDVRRSHSTNQGALRGFQRFEARRFMDESQLLFHRARAKDLNPPVDFRALDYVSPHDDNLVCPICRCPFVDPVILSECDHCFCRDCIRQTWASHPLGPRGDCPTCRTPAKLGPRSATSKIIVNILDDLRVQCPRHVEGCEAVVKRGEVQDHVTLYCGYSLIECLGEECTQAVMRKSSAEGCLHFPVSCVDCRQPMLKSMLDYHWKLECSDRKVICTQCDSDINYRELDDHNRNSCPAISVACPGQEYGCTVRSRRAQLEAHANDCVLAKLGPYMQAQKQRLDEHETAQRQMSRKLELLEQGVTNIQRLLNPQLDDPDSASADKNRIPFLPNHRRAESFATAPLVIDDILDTMTEARPDSVGQTATVRSEDAVTERLEASFFPPSTTTQLSVSSAHAPYTSPIHHLLSMHENLRVEVTRIQSALSELDGRQSMQVLNESLRNREENAYLGGQIAGLSRQLHWLTSAQLQRQQGGATGAPQQNAELGDSASAGVGVEAAVNAVANAASALRGAARIVSGTAGPSTTGLPEAGRMRRGTSEEGRTKL